MDISFLCTILVSFLKNNFQLSLISLAKIVWAMRVKKEGALHSDPNFGLVLIN